jgi:hypothetical protein
MLPPLLVLDMNGVSRAGGGGRQSINAAKNHAIGGVVRGGAGRRRRSQSLVGGVGESRELISESRVSTSPGFIYGSLSLSFAPRVRGISARYRAMPR